MEGRRRRRRNLAKWSRRHGATAAHVLTMELPPHGSLTSSAAHPGGRRAGLYRGAACALARRTPRHGPPGRAVPRCPPRFLTVPRRAPLRCGRWGRRSPGRGSRAASCCISGEDIACHIRVVDRLLRNVGPRWSDGKEKLRWLTKLQPVGNKSLPCDNESSYVIMSSLTCGQQNSLTIEGQKYEHVWITFSPMTKISQAKKL
jgi:hypothetical protein